MIRPYLCVVVTMLGFGNILVGWPHPWPVVFGVALVFYGALLLSTHADE